MTQEQKAKRYDEAIKYGRYLIDTRCKEGSDGSFHRADLQKMFPELKESEDEQHRKWILEYLYDGLRKSDKQFKDQFKCAIAWLEKQGELVNSLSKGLDNAHERIDGLIQKNNELCIKLEKQGEQKPAWSEEDEQSFIKSVEALEDFGKFELADWLKEHKDQFLKPQNTWKPNDEQMGALANACDCKEFRLDYLNSLYQDLKKLREK